MGGDEGPIEIDKHTESLQVVLSYRREIMTPVLRVCEVLDCVRRYSHISQDIVLRHRFLLFVLGQNFGREVRGVTVAFQLKFQFLCCSTNGHSCAVESKREQNVKSSDLFVPGVELAFRQTEGMPQVQLPVHVGIRECFKVFRGVRVGGHFEKVFPPPDELRPVLELYQLVPACGGLLVFHDFNTKLLLK